MNEPMSIAKIGSQVPYETVHKRQIERIVGSCYEINLIKVTPERGAEKYTLNEIYFSKSELKKINRRAIARIMNPKDVRVKPSDLHEISKNLFVQVERENCAVEPRAFTTQNDKPVTFDTQEEKIRKSLLYKYITIMPIKKVDLSLIGNPIEQISCRCVYSMLHWKVTETYSIRSRASRRSSTGV
jgi:hypothetical protein